MSEDVKTTDLAAAEELNDQMQHRRDKLAQYEDKGVYPFGQRFVVREHTQEVKDDFINFDGQPVVMAGRLMTMRSHGKTAFANIRDKAGDIQIYFRKDVMGEEAYEFVKCSILVISLVLKAMFSVPIRVKSPLR